MASSHVSRHRPADRSLVSVIKPTALQAAAVLSSRLKFDWRENAFYTNNQQNHANLETLRPLLHL
jgi:hypothetical protein